MGRFPIPIFYLGYNMNPHEVERTIAGIACGFFFILGGLTCSFVHWKADSVKVNQTYYCEVK
jgi:hypothetical protein